ncbi:MAG: SDR family oxidoreductase [Actinobacteria bacterium]|nr:SDR family oxidoreductase [Actinomycetota bacterium]
MNDQLTPLRQLVDRSNRIGDDASLVVYGGGNTSAKGTVVDHLGREQQVMWVKGSGADMRGSIDTDYPALRLSELTALRDRGEMTDEEMTDLVTRALMDPGARRPSIETLLHAFLPFTHIDHVHADAICALTNHAEGERVTRQALGDGFAYVDWIRPGFELSKIVGDLAHYEGVVLAHHGLVTWAEDSRECYQRTIDVVDAARAFVAEHSINPGPPPRHDDMPDEELETLSYVERNADSMPEGYSGHDPMPRVALVPGVGAITTGQNTADAKVAADIAVHTHGVARTVLDSFGEPEPLSDVETFRFDYWPMELYKLSLKPAPAEFAGRVAIVTGAAAGIGRGIALSLARSGCSLVLADLDASGLDEVASTIIDAGGPEPVTLAGDQSDSSVVRSTVATAIRHFGGLDGVVMNAGIGVTGSLAELTDEKWRAALDINLTSAFALTRESMRALQVQGIGGSLVFVASKNSFSPGADFGAYSVSKAGMVQLMRIAALEGGKSGIRSNAVNPDAVFDNSRLWDSGLRQERAAAHGIAPDQLEDFYASRNILKRRVTTADVAASVEFLLSDRSSRTTGSVMTVDGGVAGAFPR